MQSQCHEKIYTRTNWNDRGKIIIMITSILKCTYILGEFVSHFNVKEREEDNIL